MVLAEDLRQAVLQAALQGKLTEQLDTDSDVDDLLGEIREHKSYLEEHKKIYKKKATDPFFEKDFPFEIPDNWKWIQLSDVSIIQEGAGIRKYQYTASGTQLLTVTNILENNIDLKKQTIFIAKEEYENKYMHLTVNKGDIVSACSGGSWGKTAIYNEDATVMLNTSTLRLRFFDDLANNGYLYLLTKSAFFRDQIAKQQVGIQPNFGYSHYSRICIPFPPIEEQQRIVDKINELMLKIDEYEKIEKELEVLRRNFSTDMEDALLQAAMQGKLTERMESDSSVDEFLRNQEIDILDEGDYPHVIPVNWRFVEFGDLTSIPIKRGKSPKYTDKSGILVFAQKCNHKSGKISLDDAKYLDESIKYKYEQENYLQGNDIVINSTGGGTLGRIGYISEELIKNSLPVVPDSHVTTIRTRDNVLPRYIYFFLKFNQSYLETMGVGSTNQTELRPDTIKELVVPLPPIEEQQRIVERLDVLLPLCEDLKMWSML